MGCACAVDRRDSLLKRAGFSRGDRTPNTCWLTRPIDSVGVDISCTRMTDVNSGTPERTESPEDKFTAEIPDQEEESSLLDAALGDVAVTEDQDNLLDDTGDASQIEDPVRPACTKEYVVGQVDYSI